MTEFADGHKLPQGKKEDLNAAITYFDNQKPRMKYAQNKAQHLPIGSGGDGGGMQSYCKTALMWLRYEVEK